MPVGKTSSVLVEFTSLQKIQNKRKFSKKVFFISFPSIISDKKIFL